MTMGSLSSPPFAFEYSPRAFEMVCGWVCGDQRSTHETSMFKMEIFHNLASMEINFLRLYYDFVSSLN